MRGLVPRIETRRATLDDLDVLLADVQAGFDSYVEFAPTGWQPPKVPADRDRSSELLGDPATWALIALAEDRPVGHVAFLPARERRTGEPSDTSKARAVIPGLVHLWQLFVLPAWWGHGVAPLLHEAAIREMRAQGYSRARLFTPSLHGRARRFYERRGWSAEAEEWNEELALTLTEYRLMLS
jgi:GNAT superfamily N-acetyltransferase